MARIDGASLRAYRMELAGVNALMKGLGVVAVFVSETMLPRVGNGDRRG